MVKTIETLRPGYTVHTLICNSSQVPLVYKYYMVKREIAQIIYVIHIFLFIDWLKVGHMIKNKHAILPKSTIYGSQKYYLRLPKRLFTAKSKQ